MNDCTGQPRLLLQSAFYKDTEETQKKKKKKKDPTSLVDFQRLLIQSHVLLTLWAMTTKSLNLLLYADFCFVLFVFLFCFLSFLHFQLLKEAKENLLYKCIHFTFRNSDVQIIVQIY